MESYRIGVVGCAGRMGRMIARIVQETEGCVLSGGSDRPDCGALGSDLGVLAGLGELGLPVSDDTVTLFARSDAVVDFTTPEATAAHADLAAQAHAVHVVGTTGLDPAQEARITLAAKHTAVIRAANMSLGVNLLLGLVEQVARALDPDYDIEVLEMHHRHKVGRALGHRPGPGRGGGGRPRDRAGPSRGAQPRRHHRAAHRGDIGFATLRGGDVAGDHSVVFAGPGRAHHPGAPGDQPRGLRQGRGQGRALGPGQEARPLLHARRAGDLAESKPRGPKPFSRKNEAPQPRWLPARPPA